MAVQIELFAPDSRSAGPSGLVSPRAIFTFEQQRIIVGRGEGADVRIPHRSISLHHCMIEQRENQLYVVDLESTNGTYVAGLKIVAHRPKLLRSGDRVDIGEFTLRIGETIAAVSTSDATWEVARDLIDDALKATLSNIADRAPLVRWSLPDEPDGPSRTYPLGAPPTRVVIGRGDECAITLDDEDASREHAELMYDRVGVTIRDLGSKNGVLVNGQATRVRRLRDGDAITIGRTVLRLEDPTDRMLTELSHSSDIAETTPLSARARLASTARPETGDTASVPPDEAPAAKADAAAPAAEEPARSVVVSTPRKRGRMSTLSIVVYALAFATFVVSLGSLIWLLTN